MWNQFGYASILSQHYKMCSLDDFKKWFPSNLQISFVTFIVVINPSTTIYLTPVYLQGTTVSFYAGYLCFFTDIYFLVFFFLLLCVYCAARFCAHDYGVGID